MKLFILKTKEALSNQSPSKGDWAQVGTDIVKISKHSFDGKQWVAETYEDQKTTSKKSTKKVVMVNTCPYATVDPGLAWKGEYPVVLAGRSEDVYGIRAFIHDVPVDAVVVLSKGNSKVLMKKA